MARTTTRTCDICRKPTPRIVAKLFYGPIIKGSSNAIHSNYTHHLDVGECCGGGSSKILKLFNWQKRRSAKEYAESRRNGGA